MIAVLLNCYIVKKIFFDCDLYIVETEAINIKKRQMQIEIALRNYISNYFYNCEDFKNMSLEQ